VRVNVHAHNISDLPAVTRLLLEDIGPPFFRVAAVSSIGTRTRYGADTFPTPAQRLQAMRLLTRLDRQYPGRIRSSSGPLAEWKMFQAMEAARSRGDPVPDRGHLVGCQCVFTRISVRSDGAYVPCVLLPELVA
jgi:MoaA/NifB/PqqE/SkfB family radical SAM enzyme